MKLLSRILMICLLFSAQAVYAVEVKGLFEAEVITQSLSATDKESALKEALTLVISRVAVGDDLLQNATIKSVLNNPAFYVQQVQYALNADQINKKPARIMRVLFNEDALMAVLRNSNLAIWNEVRDEVLVWLVVDKFNSKALLNIKEDFEVYSSVQAVAKKKGLPLMLPLMDLEDKHGLVVDDILGVYSDKVLQASQRYGVTAILSGSVINKRNCWHSEWTLHFNGKVKQWSLPCEPLEKTLTTAMQGVYEELAAFHAIKVEQQQEGRIVLNISGIKGMTAESNIKTYLKKLPKVNAVKWLKVEQGRHVFELDYAGQRFDLEDTIDLQRILLKQPSTNENELNYQLVSQ